MSWDAYTAAMLSSGQMTGAAIIGHNGGIWHDSGVGFTGDESVQLANRMTNFNSGAGIVINGAKFMATQCTEDCLTGRKGTCGIVVYKSSQVMKGTLIYSLYDVP
jgi:hypothetical protein